MKKLIFLFFALLLVNCQYGEKAQGDDYQAEFAKSISHKLLSSQKEGGFYELTKEEATERMIQGLNEAVQKESYKRIKQAFGNYKNLELDTIFAIKEDQTYHVFRFKGEFEVNEKVEIRTVLNLEGKLAGFFVVPWKEAF
ncbi:hypothetical protein [Tamlana crocina]|uniref:DUF3887 domain-containing protein n=1 Tax=Tamlana crocina TaxID=393006 RepID=A0ABX1DH97_9FLAO|nr:hypothetical protein [Tamlana crocina]NJX16033.1 hypothetical protein [Tamlana crocina]